MQLALLRDFLYCCFGNLICAIIGLSNPIHQKKKEKEKEKKKSINSSKSNFQNSPWHSAIAKAFGERNLYFF